MDMSFVSQGVFNFLSYFGISLVYILVFGIVYTKTTPYHEFEMIKNGNVAASISLAGALLGFCLPVASVVIHSVSLSDMALWSAVACVVQLLTFYFIAFVCFPKQIKNQIESGNVAVAIFIAMASLVVGVINAASMTY